MISATKPELKGDAYWKEVRRLHERTVGRTQNVTDPLDFNGLELEARRNPLARIPLFFANQANQVYTMLSRSVMRYRTSDRSRGAKAKLAADIGMVALQAAWSVAVTVAWQEAKRYLRYGSRDDEDKKHRTLAGTILREAIRETGGYVYMGDDVGGFVYDVLTKGGYETEAPNNVIADRAYRAIEGAAELLGALSEGDTEYQTGPHKGEEKRTVMGVRGAREFLVNLAVMVGIPAEPPLDYAEMAWRLWLGPKDEPGPKPASSGRSPSRSASDSRSPSRSASEEP